MERLVVGEDGGMVGFGRTRRSENVEEQKYVGGTYHNRASRGICTSVCLVRYSRWCMSVLDLVNAFASGYKSKTHIADRVGIPVSSVCMSLYHVNN